MSQTLAQERLFAKGYAPMFSEEIYVICNRKPNFPAPLYKLSDGLANPIMGRYYAEELQCIS